MSEENKEVQYQDKQSFWEPHINGWKESGISQADYCRSQGLNIRVFGYWKRKLCRKAPESGFVPVLIKPAGAVAGRSDASLRLIIREDLSIEIGDRFNPDTLRKLLHKEKVSPFPLTYLGTKNIILTYLLISRTIFFKINISSYI